MFSSASLSVLNFKLAPRLLSGLLRHLGTRHGLAPADGRQSIAELLRGEDADALLLHGKRILLASGLHRLCSDQPSSSPDELYSSHGHVLSFSKR